MKAEKRMDGLERFFKADNSNRFILIFLVITLKIKVESDLFAHASNCIHFRNYQLGAQNHGDWQ